MTEGKSRNKTTFAPRLLRWLFQCNCLIIESVFIFAHDQLARWTVQPATSSWHLSPRRAQPTALRGPSSLSLPLRASRTNALVMVRWLFVPTGSAGHTRHPFYFGASWLSIRPKRSFFSLPERGFLSQRGGKVEILLSPLIWGHTARQAVNTDMMQPSGVKLMHRKYISHSAVYHHSGETQHGLYSPVNY